MREIGKNIRAARLRRGMTQDELAEGAALAALGSGIFLLRRLVGRLFRRAFTGAPLYLIQSVAVPAFYLLLGWVLLRACGVFLGAKPLECRRARPLRRAVLAAPIVVSNLCVSIHILLRGLGVPWDSGFSLPRWWERAGIWQLYVAARFPAVFVPFGAALWGTRLERREENP